MLFLITDILRYFRTVGMRNGKSRISVLPFEILALRKCLMNPDGHAGFDVSDGILNGYCWRERRQKMQMILRAIRFEQLSVEFANDSAGVFHQLG